jgi:hypothetical protein
VSGIIAARFGASGRAASLAVAGLGAVRSARGPHDVSVRRERDTLMQPGRG